MERFLLFVIIGMLFWLGGKIDEGRKEEDQSERRKKAPMKAKIIREYVGKRVTLNIDQENIMEEYLFNVGSSVPGIITEVADTWLVFKYETKREIVTRYFRLVDIMSIDIVQE